MTESLADLIALVERASDPKVDLVAHLVARIEKDDPILADAVRLCAIPRRLDAHVVAVLRDSTDDDVNRRTLERLAAHSFALRRDDGSLVYHDDTRDALLREWRQDPERKARFDAVSTRLIQYHLRRHDEDRRIRNDLMAVAAILEEANAERHAQIASAADARIGAALHEALYHATLMSPYDALELFEWSAASYMTMGHPLAQSLLTAIEQFTTELPFAVDDAWRRWYRYFQLQIARGSSDEPSHVLEPLLELLEEAEGDIRLQVWILDDVTTMLVGTDRVGEGIAYAQQLIGAAESSDAEPATVAVAYLRLANM